MMVITFHMVCVTVRSNPDAVTGHVRAQILLTHIRRSAQGKTSTQPRTTCTDANTCVSQRLMTKRPPHPTSHQALSLIEHANVHFTTQQVHFVTMKLCSTLLLTGVLSTSAFAPKALIPKTRQGENTEATNESCFLVRISVSISHI